MLNKAILMGRLVRDPEMRRTQNDTPVASFTLAIDRQANKDGNKQTDFIDCVAWSKQAEFLCKWFTKGMMVVVVGSIQSRNWEDKNGSKRTSIEVKCDELQFGESKKNREGGEAKTGTGGFHELADDEDVPF